MKTKIKKKTKKVKKPEVHRIEDLNDPNMSLMDWYDKIDGLMDLFGSDAFLKLKADYNHNIHAEVTIPIKKRKTYYFWLTNHTDTRDNEPYAVSAMSENEAIEEARHKAGQRFSVGHAYRSARDFRKAIGWTYGVEIDRI